MNELELFKSQTLTVMRTLSAIKKQKDELEKTEKEFRTALQEAMDKYNIVKFENEYVKISEVKGSVTKTIDLKKLQDHEPELYDELLHDYLKTTERKPSIRITIK